MLRGALRSPFVTIRTVGELGPKLAFVRIESEADNYSTMPRRQWTNSRRLSYGQLAANKDRDDCVRISRVQHLQLRPYTRDFGTPGLWDDHAALPDTRWRDLRGNYSSARRSGRRGLRAARIWIGSIR